MTLRSRATHNEALLRNVLLAAIAGGAVATAGAGCEPDVVDGEGGNGATKGVTVGAYTPEIGNGTGASGGASAGQGGGTPSGGGAAPSGPWCNAVDDYDEYEEPELYYVCSNSLGSPCPALNENVVFQKMIALVNEPNGCGIQVDDVLCGPDPGAEDCCYVVRASYSICEGRPFMGSSGPVVARATPREDWSVRRSLDGIALGPSARETLGRAWSESALAEHASVASFARLVLELLALGAPAELVRDAQQALGDEIEHAALSFGMASALLETKLGPGPLDVDAAPLRSLDPVAFAVATVLEGCVNETVSACLALAERDAATVPAARSALERIAQDEVRHAALSWRIATWLIQKHGEPVREAVRAAFEGARPEVSVPATAGVDPIIARSYGRLPHEEAADVIQRAFDEAVLPAAAALLAQFGRDATAFTAERS
jgi:hypothetical protein